MERAYYVIVTGLLALPSYAAAQALPTAPPSGYYNAVAANPKGTVTNFTYGSSYRARVYTPPGYSTSRTYAVMYLMHGMGGSEASWHDNDLYAHIQLDNLLAQGKVDPFIIVFTQNDMNNYAFGPILLTQLMPYIDANYCVSTDPNNRALGGLSMGGMLTINIGFPNADKFHYLMPSSPAPGIQGQAQLFPSSIKAARQALRLLFFTCGSAEVGAYGCNNADTLRGYAESDGLGSIIKNWNVQGGAHNSATWRPSFWNFAQLAHEAGFTRVETASRCGPGNTTGAGGTTGTGGAKATGGTTSSGGITATGGAAASGGTTGSQATGGRANAGQSSGGQATGGRNTGGAATATGGSPSTGGSPPSTGGASSNGGSPGNGGQATGGLSGTVTTGSGGMPAGGQANGGGTSNTTTATGGLPGTGGSLPSTVGGTSVVGNGGQAGGGASGTFGEGSEEGGCSCSLPGSGRRAGWLLLPLLGFIASRRRRRSTR